MKREAALWLAVGFAIACSLGAIRQQSPVSGRWQVLPNAKGDIEFMLFDTATGGLWVLPREPLTPEKNDTIRQAWAEIGPQR